MNKVALIGIGSLGIRHLQALENLGDDYEVYGIDASDEIIRKLKTEYPDVYFSTSIRDLPRDIGVAVIATTSNVRRSVFEELVRHTNVKQIIFEKVLFQSADDYDVVKGILSDKGITAWVNCPRREYPSFGALRERLKEKTIKSISVTGGNWGIGTSGIHFLDFIEFISGIDRCKITYSALSGPIIESKRKGYVEFYGYIAGKCGDTDYIIRCYENSNTPIQIFIETEDEYIRILESKQKMYISNKDNDWSWDEQELPIPYVSQLTDKIVKKIVETGACLLPTYEISMETHLEYLGRVLELLKTNGMGDDICPIT